MKSILDLASALRLGVVAEGIETEAQRDALQELGANVGQGLLLGPPSDRVRTTELLGANGSQAWQLLAARG